MNTNDGRPVAVGSSEGLGGSREQRDTEGPRGTYGCACVSRDARECMARRYPELTLGPQPDDMGEYIYMHAERCQCLCHEWDDDE